MTEKPDLELEHAFVQLVLSELGPKWSYAYRAYKDWIALVRTERTNNPLNVYHTIVGYPKLPSGFYRAYEIKVRPEQILLCPVQHEDSASRFGNIFDWSTGIPASDPDSHLKIAQRILIDYAKFQAD